MWHAFLQRSGSARPPGMFRLVVQFFDAHPVMVRINM
jgi:hypothetical protein